MSGDASVLMNIQELSTAVQHRTPVKVVLCNNGYMGMVRQWQELNHGNRLSHSWNEALPDFVALARAFGWGARRVPTRPSCDGALAECLAADGPFFLDVQVARAGKLLSDDARRPGPPPRDAGQGPVVRGRLTAGAGKPSPVTMAGWPAIESRASLHTRKEPQGPT